MNVKLDLLSDEDLIKRYREGDAASGEYLVNRYKPLVRKKARLFYLEGGDPEDVLQEGMLGFFRAIRKYDPEKQASFHTFAGVCISHQIISAIEAANRKKHDPLNGSVSIEDMDAKQAMSVPGNVNDPEEIVMEQEAAEQLLERIRKLLSPMEKKVFEFFLEGYDYRDIAGKLGRSEKSVDNCLQRIKTKIKKNAKKETD